MHDEHGSEPSLTVTSSDSADGRAVVVAASGEVDMGTAPQLRRAIHDAFVHAAETAATAVVVDLSGVAFMSSPGLGALISAHDVAVERSMSLLVATGAEQGVLRPLQATYLHTVLDAHPTVEDALRAVPAREASETA